jgi:hypothetical protein
VFTSEILTIAYRIDWTVEKDSHHAGLVPSEINGLGRGVEMLDSAPYGTPSPRAFQNNSPGTRRNPLSLSPGRLGDYYSGMSASNGLSWPHDIIQAKLANSSWGRNDLKPKPKSEPQTKKKPKIKLTGSS